jgi:hypothetical protein
VWSDNNPQEIATEHNKSTVPMTTTTINQEIVAKNSNVKNNKQKQHQR